jgi:hypothetical protein
MNRPVTFHNRGAYGSGVASSRLAISFVKGTTEKRAQQMLEWTQAGNGSRLMILVHHDDAKREYATGPEEVFQILMLAHFLML